MIKITHVTKKNQKKTEAFELKEWQKWDETYYGKDTDAYFYKEFRLQAKDAEKLIGILEAHIEMGVLFVSDIIVATDCTGRGIGKLLLNAAIKYGKKHGIHKVTLFTGVGWGANKFYQSLGFVQSGILKNHFHHHDFVIYEKNL